jgi:hypothetical protein
VRIGGAHIRVQVEWVQVEWVQVEWVQVEWVQVEWVQVESNMNSNRRFYLKDGGV